MLESDNFIRTLYISLHISGSINDEKKPWMWNTVVTIFLFCLTVCICLKAYLYQSCFDVICKGFFDLSWSIITCILDIYPIKCFNYILYLMNRAVSFIFSAWNKSTHSKSSKDKQWIKLSKHYRTQHQVICYSGLMNIELYYWVSQDWYVLHPI